MHDLETHYEIIDNLKKFIVSFTSEVEIIEYQIKMINNNGLIPCLSISRKDKRLIYAVEDYIPWSQYDKECDGNGQRDLKILKIIAVTLSECRNYFLCDNCFLLDLNYIFLHKDSGAIKLVYIPVNNKNSGRENFKKLIIQVFNREKNNEKILKSIWGGIENMNYEQIAQRLEEFGVSKKNYTLQPVSTAAGYSENTNEYGLGFIKIKDGLFLHKGFLAALIVWQAGVFLVLIRAAHIFNDYTIVVCFLAALFLIGGDYILLDKMIKKN